MYLTGFADEASSGIEGQIAATKELGWSCIEARNIKGTNIHDIPEKDFEEVCQKLEDANVHVNCFGSAIANWASKISDPPQECYDQLNRAIPRMNRLGTKLIRIMSFNVPDEESTLDNEPIAQEVCKRVAHLAKMAEDAGITLVHENCNAWGGRSWEHSLKLVETVNSPALKLVFDTGNPVFEKDIRGETPYSYQDSFEYYSNVKDHIAYIHIKDGRMVGDEMEYSHAGEGDGNVVKILENLFKNGYDGGISIEPHLAQIAHDSSVTASEEHSYATYIEYGKRLEKLVRDTGWEPQARP